MQPMLVTCSIVAHYSVLWHLPAPGSALASATIKLPEQRHEAINGNCHVGSAAASVIMRIVLVLRTRCSKASVK